MKFTNIRSLTWMLFSSVYLHQSQGLQAAETSQINSKRYEDIAFLSRNNFQLLKFSEFLRKSDVEHSIIRNRKSELLPFFWARVFSEFPSKIMVLLFYIS